jgi:hypothetical protein
MSPAQLHELDARQSGQVGVRRRGPTADYNCHGLTFVNRLGWFASMHMGAPHELAGTPRAEAEDTDEHIRILLDDCGFRRIVTLPNMKVDLLEQGHGAQLGDVILYLDSGKAHSRIDHSGIIIGVISQPWPDLRVLSKFGMNGEYVHPYRQVPDAYPTTIEIWTDR